MRKAQIYIKKPKKLKKSGCVVSQLGGTLPTNVLFRNETGGPFRLWNEMSVKLS